jgi:hypothetical protein
MDFHKTRKLELENHNIELFHKWRIDLAYDDPTSLMALLSWYVVVKTKPSP